MKNVGSFCFLFVFITVLFITGCQESEAKDANDKPALQEQKQASEPAAAQIPSIQAPTPAKPVVKAASRPAEAVKGPKLLVTKDVHDFGNVGPATDHVCNFTLQNIGTETLIIDTVQSTCGCSVPKMQKNEYAPGESGAIEVRFHAPSSKGTTKKQLYIISNDPSNPRAQLEIQATIQVNVEIEPHEVSLMLNKPNAGLVPITIKGLDDRKFSITKVTSTNNVISCPFDPTRKATEFVLQPVADTALLAKFLSGVISIEVDHPQGGTLLVRYSTLPQYEINRPRIILQNAKPGQVERKEVLITSHYGDTLKIKNSSSRMGMMKIVEQKMVESPQTTDIKDQPDLNMKTVEQQSGVNSLNLTIEISIPQQEAANKRYISDELKITFENDQEIVIRASGWFKN